ncbi:spore gernimation protein [Gordoniibacillus kamchatkensis]|uniref:Spore gernimation protein n=1 Tax=Gordoniibacillus kamchatkensis TaxID=1590651 RepID=A0ABR5ADY7_9BACL|nr:endospore germination permease [Paenibacillus sp. VKM B-2647]KIL39053.1 spore gernimation protein [Paenibacillus sp. VKM B-2647]
MLEKGRISAFQMAIMMYPTVLATGFLALPTITAQYANNDLWLTGIVASLSGFLAIFVTTRLHELYPKQTIIESSEHIVGKIPGKMLGIAYFLFFMHVTGFISREYAEFVKGNFLFKTPIILIIASIVLLAALAVRGGVEMLARSAVIFTPIFILPLFFLLLLIPDLDTGNLLPVLHRGFVPVLKGTATPQAWLSEFFLMTFLLPTLTCPDQGKKWGLISLIVIVLSMTYVNLMTYSVFGIDTGNKTSPMLIAFRYIRLGDFFENLEAVLLAMWVVGNFVKISMFFYATVLSFAQCFTLSDYRPTVLPIGILIVAFSLFDLPSFPVMASVIRYAIPFYLPAFLVVIPLVLLIAAVLRKPQRTGKGEQAP